MEKKYYPYGKNILIRRSKNHEEVKKGKIILTNEVKPYYYAYIVETPKGYEDLDLRDSEVLVNSYAGTKIDENDESIFLLVKQEDIMCIVNGD